MDPRAARTIPDGLKVRWPDIRPEDRAAVAAVLERGILGGVGAPESTALENEWAAYVGRSTGLLFNSGTAAIHAALYGIDLQPGDEVITTAFTFAGTWQPILQQLGVPVFVDIDPRTYNLDPRQIEAKIGPRTKAIIAVHINGLPADMDEILDIADRHGLYVIEDACQAHGATHRGRQVGSMGVVGCYSLNSSKILTGGEGGLLVADDPDIIQRARRLRTFGEDIPELAKLTGWNFRPYTVYSVGWNYRHQEMPAALARSQLKRLDEYIAIGQRNAAYLSEQLADVPGIEPPYIPADRTSSLLRVSDPPRSGPAGPRRRRADRIPRRPRQDVDGGGRRLRDLAYRAGTGIPDLPGPCRVRGRVPVDAAAGGPGHQLRRGGLPRRDGDARFDARAVRHAPPDLRPAA